MQTYKMTIQEAADYSYEYAEVYDRMFEEVFNELLKEHSDPSDANMIEEIAERVTIERLSEAGYNLPRSI